MYEVLRITAIQNPSSYLIIDVFSRIHDVRHSCCHLEAIQAQQKAEKTERCLFLPPGGNWNNNTKSMTIFRPPKRQTGKSKQ